MPKPFLFRFRATKDSSIALEIESRYDPNCCQTLIITDTGLETAIHSSAAKGLATKKEDLEIGEDLKDRWMFKQ